MNKKRICIYTYYTNGAYLYIYTKTTLLITLLAKNIARKIFNQKRIQKEKYEMKEEK